MHRYILIGCRQSRDVGISWGGLGGEDQRGRLFCGLGCRGREGGEGEERRLSGDVVGEDSSLVVVMGGDTIVVSRCKSSQVVVDVVVDMWNFWRGRSVSEMKIKN